MAIMKTAVFTLHDDSTLTVEDSANAMYASSALAAFKNYKTAKLVVAGGEGEDATVYEVPFHAVIKVQVTETASEEEAVEDDFCPSSEDDGQ